MQHIEDLSKKRKQFIVENINNLRFTISEKIDGLNAKLLFTPNNVFLQTRSKKIFSDSKQFNDKIYYMRDIKNAYMTIKNNYIELLYHKIYLNDEEYVYRHKKLFEQKKIISTEGELLPVSQWNIIDYSNYCGNFIGTIFFNYKNFINFMNNQFLMYNNGEKEFIYKFDTSDFEISNKKNILNFCNDIMGYTNIRDIIEGYVINIYDKVDQNQLLFNFKVIDKDNFTKKKINDWALIEKMKKARKLDSKTLAFKELDIIEKELENYFFYTQKKKKDSIEELALSRDILDGKIAW